MTLERDPEVQQIITALKQITAHPSRFSEEFKRQAMASAIGLIQDAYRVKYVPPPPQTPGQLDLLSTGGW